MLFKVPISCITQFIHLVHTDDLPPAIVKPIFMGTFAIASEQVIKYITFLEHTQAMFSMFL